jgi:hypothetical protein
MPKIAIVGAGQCGLTLAAGLLRTGDHEVTIVSALTADQVRTRRPTSTQVMFEPTLAIERDRGLALWDDQTPAIEALHMTLAPTPQTPRLDLVGRLPAPARSVDQRVKMARLLDELDQHVRTRTVTVDDLEGYLDSGRYDLVVVAAGRGELAELFTRIPERSPYTTPQRKLAVCYVHGMAPDPDVEVVDGHFNVVPGAGEIIVIPALTTTGTCDIIFVEAIPGGPMDVFDAGMTPQQHLAALLDVLRTNAPWLAERCTEITPTDPNANLVGAFTPTVRNPVGILPSGRAVLGLADVVLANDPITAQGSNAAARAAAFWEQAIRDHGDGPFGTDWMHANAERFWTEIGETPTRWTNELMLPHPPAPHVAQILGAATQFPEVADRIAYGFTDPDDLNDWFMTPEAAERYLGEVVARHQAATS